MSDEATAGSIKLFRITEDDLAELERLLPVFQDGLFPRLAKDEPGSACLRVQLRKAKDIVSNVRWCYGPPADVKTIRCDEQPE